MPRMKFLFVAALLALCVGSLAGAALAADSWDVTADDFPATLGWDASYAASVDATNDGTTTWSTGFSLKSVGGPTTAPVAVDRWGPIAVPVGVSVAPLAVYAFDFGISAPPISSLSYVLPITPTSAPAAAPLDCNWVLADGADALITTDFSVNAVAVHRFSDAANPWVDECAGRVPLIVGGYPNGYRPNESVNRAQMAVFVQRAFQLPFSNYTGGFGDVAVGFWADDYIQSCVDAGIVTGYAGGNYRPAEIVNRAAMTVFVARSMAGGDSAVPTGPSTATFTDVPTGFWTYKYTEYCVASDVVGGFLDGTYRPTQPVTRGQMAIFMYRSAIVPTGSVVVLAGPAVTAVDVSSAAYDGWTSAEAGAAADPGNAYVGIDAVRAAVEDITVTFELRNAATPTTVATGAYTADVTILAADVTTAQAAAAVSGNPYLYASWDIPAGLTPDDYILVVSVDGEEIVRRPAFTIN